VEEILWTLASAREDPNTWAKTAAAAGLERYLGFLAHLQPGIRRAAVFALLNCERSSVVEAIRLRVRQEGDERVKVRCS
jgi:hypothetical protein